MDFKDKLKDSKSRNYSSMVNRFLPSLFIEPDLVNVRRYYVEELIDENEQLKKHLRAILKETSESGFFLHSKSLNDALLYLSGENND